MFEITQVILARSVQTLRSSAGTVGYLPDLVDRLKERYSFIKAPKPEDLLPSDPPKGAEFQHGRLPDRPTVIIDKLTVFNDGVVVDAADSTDDADRFLADLQEWARTVMPKVVAVGPRYYLSQLEMSMDPPLQRFAPSLAPIGARIRERLMGYGIEATPFDVSTIHLNLDPFGKAPPVPGQFFIDRRLNVPHAKNLWFTQAPLRTVDHIALLGELDALS